MANEEHLQILKKGVDAWNRWRLERYAIKPDLIHAYLSEVALYEANLRDANLRDAVLSSVDFSRVDLSRANLFRAHLYHTDLSGADLNGADLRRTKLVGVNLNGAKLHGANLDGVTIDATVFANVDLRNVEGLENVIHQGPSEVSVSTLYRSKGQISKSFLRGCGLQDWEIESTSLYRDDLSRSQIIDLTYKVIELRSDPLIQFYSCFISYSSKDEGFAKRLYSDLQESGVRCWFAPEDMKIGDRLRPRIDDSILIHDKLLLVLSETSITSQWIEQEVATALAKEREQGCDVLFPVRLDNAVINSKNDWPALIKNTRHIGDFRQWEDPHEYAMAFKRLKDALRKGA